MRKLFFILSLFTVVAVCGQEKVVVRNDSLVEEVIRQVTATATPGSSVPKAVKNAFNAFWNDCRLAESGLPEEYDELLADKARFSDSILALEARKRTLEEAAGNEAASRAETLAKLRAQLREDSVRRVSLAPGLASAAAEFEADSMRLARLRITADSLLAVLVGLEDKLAVDNPVIRLQSLRAAMEYAAADCAKKNIYEVDAAGVASVMRRYDESGAMLDSYAAAMPDEVREIRSLGATLRADLDALQLKDEVLAVLAGPFSEDEDKAVAEELRKKGLTPKWKSDADGLEKLVSLRIRAFRNLNYILSTLAEDSADAGQTVSDILSFLDPPVVAVDAAGRMEYNRLYVLFNKVLSDVRSGSGKDYAKYKEEIVKK